MLFSFSFSSIWCNLRLRDGWHVLAGIRYACVFSIFCWLFLQTFADESTRVCLQPIRGVDGSDYINANFIDVGISVMFQSSYLEHRSTLLTVVIRNACRR